MSPARFRRRIRAILDVDETLERVNQTLERFDGTLDRFDHTLERFIKALEEFGPVVTKVDTVGSDLEGAVDRVDQLVAGIGGLAGPALSIPDQVRRLGQLGRRREGVPDAAPEQQPEGD